MTKVTDDGTTIRVTLEVETEDCPLTEVSESGKTRARLLGKTAVEDENRVTEEMAVETEDGGGPEPPKGIGAEKTFEYDSSTVYKFKREGGKSCVCESIEATGYPVSEVRSEEGSLVVTFHIPDADALREIVGDLRDEFGGVTVRELTGDGATGESLPAIVDTSVLTERQREVLETAHDMGYFDSPRRTNATELADEMGISLSTVTEHLTVAQRKILDEILGDD